MNIGLIAHDSKKTLMQNFCIAYRGILSKHELYATGTTGRLIEEVTNLSIHKYLAGPLGGKQQLGAQIAQNGIDALIFLRDPQNPKPHEPDVNDVIKFLRQREITHFQRFGEALDRLQAKAYEKNKFYMGTKKN